ncbi:zinc-binding metallopeptidase family protein [Pseudomonas sp.]|jgi:hypothetical protein|uniref:zinc-binding metallopeptidase family protein n=1 Tax=Pseudomonas sp. TaxID=306 RepID=UPI00272A36ED|nr:putative zinc-binding metallopeptidase [Pseudomonas sp.]
MSYFDQLVKRSEGSQLFDYHPNGHVQRCRCGQALFFDNTTCLRCGSELGFDPDQGNLLNIEPAEDNLWRPVTDQDASPRRFARCANLHSPAQCNWLVTDPAAAPFCVACSLNMTIPDLNLADNAAHWMRAEQAKRRLVAQLMLLGLPVVSRKLDPEKGLGFNMLRQLPGQDPVMTGHADGVITLDMDEADPAHRERVRENMHEPYRTLLGHFRHESGHYYWDRLVRDSHWLEPVRAVFGDDRIDYQQALARHYENGPPADWNTRFISSYASTHPWEDWAETWAHYLHMTDTLNVAMDFGIQLDALALHTDPFDSSQLAGLEGNADKVVFLAFINRWIQLSSVLNVLSRSMGQPDIYPFVLTVDSVRKLYLVHAVVADYGSAGAPG